jgi:protein-tyrosine kinase
MITPGTQVRDPSSVIGDILVEAGHLTLQQVDEITRYAAESGLQFGAAGLKLGLLSKDAIQFAINTQFYYPLIGRDGDDGVTDAVVAAYDPHNPVVENLRTIRSRLSQGWLATMDRKILAIVSPGRHEGRSWFAANLAVVFAQAGERTLLIDTDMRNPCQHKLFKLPGDNGLSTALTGRAQIDIFRRVHPNLRLFVMTSGIVPPNPQELITRNVFDALLGKCATAFDVVVLDTPAADGTADAELIAARAGAAVLLARRDFTKQSDLMAANRILSRSGVKVVGSVINTF